MEARTVITVSGTSPGPPGSPGPGGWAAAIQIPRHHTIRVSGSDPRTHPARMKLTAAVRGLAELRELANVEGAALEIATDSLNLIQSLDGWLRTGEHDGDPGLWKELGRMELDRNVRMRLVDPMDRNTIMEECTKRADQEARTASAHPGMGQQVHRSGQGGDSRQEQEFARGYWAGYEAAKTDMANALNQIHRGLPADEPDDLPF